MAPKRAAPPPPVESSDETRSGSGSGSGSDESDEEIAYSPPPSAGPKNIPPPPQKIQQPEASEEEEEEEEEEEGEEEEEEEDGDEEEEEEEDKANHAAPPSATKTAPPPPKHDQSESDEEETDDEAPQPVSAPKQKVVEENGGKPPPSSEDKKPTAPFQRCWSKEDEVRILEALASHRREHGTLPQPEELEAALAGRLENSDYGRKELMGKVKSLKSMHTRTVKRGDPPSKDLDRRIFDLAKEVWAAGEKLENGAVSGDFDEVCRKYPYLGEELKDLNRTHPGLFKREFSMIDDTKAHALDQKIKKQRMLQIKLELRGREVSKEVTKTLMDLVD